MSIASAVNIWRGLAAASPHGCRVHLTGGEAFGDWEKLIEICNTAWREGLSTPGGAGPLEKVETNAFWAADAAIVRERIGALDAAGMGKFAISADPYHQEFVPIERCRLAASVAEEVLGAARVQVRWRDWLASGFDTDKLSPDERNDLFAKYAGGGRDRWNGRAADELATNLPACGKKLCMSAASFADKNCTEALLRSRHVHVDATGAVMPGICAGILLGRIDPADPSGVAALWRKLNEDHADRPVVGRLAKSGPTGLMQYACELGFSPDEYYAGKCHLCWAVRRFLARRGLHSDELGPAWLYEQSNG